MKTSSKSKWSSVLLSSLLLLQLATATTVSAEQVEGSLSDDKGTVVETEKPEVPGPTEDQEDSGSVEGDGESYVPDKPEKPEPEEEEEEVTEPEEDEPADEDISYPTDVQEHVKLVDELFNKYKKGANEEIGKEFLHALAHLPLDDDTMSFTSKAQYLEKYEKVSKGIKPTLLLELNHYVVAEMLEFASGKKKEGQRDAIFITDYLHLLSDSKEDKKLKKAVEELIDSLRKPIDDIVGDGVGDWDGSYGDGSFRPNPDKPVVRPPGFKPGATQKPVQLPDHDFSSSKSRYYLSGGSCMKETTFYKKGKVLRKNTVRADKTEAVNCLANVSAREFTAKQRAAGSVFRGYDFYNPEHRRALKERLKLERDQQLKDGKDEDGNELLDLVTIQYTFDKHQDSPYYYDTGIGIGKKKLVSYDQAKAALNIISIQAKGRYVEDKQQVLALIDGKIIRIHEYKEPVKFEVFEKEFELTPMKVRAQETRTGTQQEIADLIEIRKVSELFVNNASVKLDADLIVDNNIALYPAEQLVSLLGGKMSVQDKKLTARIAGKDFVFTEGTSAVMVDGKQTDAQAFTRQNKDGVWMIAITPLVKETGAEIYVENEQIHIDHSATN